MLSPKTVEKWVGEVKDRAVLDRLAETVNRLFRKPVGDVHAGLVNFSPEDKKRLRESTLREFEAERHRGLSLTRLGLR